MQSSSENEDTSIDKEKALKQHFEELDHTLRNSESTLAQRKQQDLKIDYEFPSRYTLEGQTINEDIQKLNLSDKNFKKAH